MALVLRSLYDGYREYFVEKRDPRSVDYPLLGSPWPVLGIIAAYLYVVLSVGPKFMANRKPYHLKNVIRVYNVLQVLANGYIFAQLATHVLCHENFSFRCQLVDFGDGPQALKELHMGYYYFLLKVGDLADTMFFVLRKKHRHVSFLHVYHHSLMVLVTYFGCVFVPGGHALILGLWNTLVHSVMYLYYLRSSFGVQHGIWWKKHLTQLQLVQFMHLQFHFARPLFFDRNCAFPTFWLWVGFLQGTIVFVLFLDFYAKSYRKKTRKT